MYPDGFMPIKAATKSPVFREATKTEHLVFCQNPESVIRVKLNQTEYVLLKSIIYCYSAIPDVSEKGRILLSEQREAYAQILLRYLQSSYGEEVTGGHPLLVMPLGAS
uniref:NR LBD domain-containing protein n=1 Tax=Acrobeloides nanus TaxID=290746 RepID=A0A914EC74_9BILA